MYKRQLERGLKVPEQFKAVGYDGVDIAKMFHPTLTYVAQPFDLLATNLVDTLIRKIDGEEITENLILPDVELVRGGTTYYVKMCIRDRPWNEIMAATLISILPVFILYLFFQKYFIQSVAMSGIKE